MKMRLGSAAIIVICVGGCTRQAQPSVDASERSPSSRMEEWRIPSTDSFVIHSTAAQRDFQVSVAVPRGYAESSAKYPALFVLDANYTFPIAVETARILAIGPKENPNGDLTEQPVIVGIGYPVGRYRNAIPFRLKDLTPTADPAIIAEVATAIGFPPETSGSGGASAFLEFVGREMLPAVASRYRIDDRRRALFGHSFGGLFAVYTLFHQPELFDSYLITSPALYWDRGAIWTFERAFADAHKDLRARVFLTGGSLDEQHTAMVRKLDDTFRARKYGGLVWQTEIFPNETHSSVSVVSLTRGIRWLYGAPAASR